MIFLQENRIFGLDACMWHPNKHLSHSIAMLKICQLAQWVNLLLALLKITRTDIFGEALQLFARSIFVFVSIENTDESIAPYVWTAFLAFSFGETLRYPYYLLKCLDADKSSLGKFFGFLRYNMFIVIYPVGAFSDLMTGVHSASNMRASGAYSIALPNAYNFAFDYPWFISRLVPFVYSLALPMNYMTLLAQRSKYFAGAKKEQVDNSVKKD